jgi:hypothetical protein
MTSPRAKPAPEKSHEHIDLGALMDGSERGPEVPEEEWANRGARGPHGAAGAYGEAADLSGETADGYVSGQDEGSID